MKPVLTPEQAFALKWLFQRGGSGIVDRYGRLIAAGEVFPKGPSAVWMRLLAVGYLMGSDGRIGLTWAASERAEELAARQKARRERAVPIIGSAA